MSASSAFLQATSSWQLPCASKLRGAQANARRLSHVWNSLGMSAKTGGNWCSTPSFQRFLSVPFDIRRRHIYPALLSRLGEYRRTFLNFPAVADACKELLDTFLTRPAFLSHIGYFTGAAAANAKPYYAPLS
jgi:hypothetical protein